MSLVSILQKNALKVALGLSLVIGGVTGCTSPSNNYVPYTSSTPGCKNDADCKGDRICDYQTGQCVSPGNISDALKTDSSSYDSGFSRNQKDIISIDTYKLKDTTPQCVPSEELCNKIDDDCDGKTDEGNLCWEQVTAGEWHACGLKESGEILCWGDNKKGQTNVPKGKYSYLNKEITDTNCALKMDGSPVCWGNDEYGVASPPNGFFNTISSGYGYACGLTTSGSVSCWGNGWKEVEKPNDYFKQISVGGLYACGILSKNNDILCWGDKFFLKKKKPFYDSLFKQLSVGGSSACAIDDTSGKIGCWGYEYDEQGLVPPSGSDYIQVSVGRHACAVKNDKSVVCWGDNEEGEASPPLGKFKQVSAGNYFSCGVKEDTSIQCWGWNYLGQLNVPKE